MRPERSTGGARKLSDRIRSVFRQYGLRGVVGAASRRLLRPRARLLAEARPLVANRKGLEIGGPSAIFERAGLVPVYQAAGALDNVNFSAVTLWSSGETPAFLYDRDKPPGRQWLAEGSDLPAIAEASYDFVLASHALEHIANPLRALHEWRRVLAPGGALLLVLPEGQRTFDHRRPITTLAHLIDDFERGTGEADDTHFAEVLSLHDLARDPDAGGRARFEDRVRRNLEFRAVHHHVFDEALAASLLRHAGFHVIAHERAAPHHLILLSRKA